MPHAPFETLQYGVMYSHASVTLTSNSPPEAPAGSSEVVRSTRGVGVHPLAQEGQVLHCRGHIMHI